MHVLYITYDGLLDPLGGSQILPYIKLLSSEKLKYYIISFEKSERFNSNANKLSDELKKLNIVWIPLIFTKQYGLLGKMWDMIKMYLSSLVIAIVNNITVVHARSHLAAQVGLFLKRILKTKLIFDFRGLWVDERVDKNGWDLSRRFDRIQYRYFKKNEEILLKLSDHIVVLTTAVLNELLRLKQCTSESVTVIPCCADFDHFTIVDDTVRVQHRINVRIPEKSVVFGYLGSVGSMYMTDRYFYLLCVAMSLRDDVYAVVITHDIDQLKEVMNAMLPKIYHNRVFITSATRDAVPEMLSLIDILVNFVLPSYARISMSPTKLAECFATGIPVICNPGVGDVAEQIDCLRAGVLVDPASKDDIIKCIYNIDKIRSMGGHRLRVAASMMLGLDIAIKRYRSVYTKIEEMS